MLLNIVTLNDKRIRFFSKKILINFKKNINFIVKQMMLIMYNYNGIGIASNQINYYEKIIIVDINEKKKKPLIMLNPKILFSNNNYTLGIEGCLSIKNFFISILRNDKIYVKYLNLYNKYKKKMFSGIISRCLQHEIDHLKGKLIIDYSNKIIK